MQLTRRSEETRVETLKFEHRLPTFALSGVGRSSQAGKQAIAPCRLAHKAWPDSGVSRGIPRYPYFKATVQFSHPLRISSAPLFILHGKKPGLSTVGVPTWLRELVVLSICGFRVCGPACRAAAHADASCAESFARLAKARTFSWQGILLLHDGRLIHVDSETHVSSTLYTFKPCGDILSQSYCRAFHEL